MAASVNGCKSAILAGIIVVGLLIIAASATVPPGSGTFVQDIHMPDVIPTQNDDYICTLKKVDTREAFIVQFEAHSENNRAHHILLFGCKDVKPQYASKSHWKCLEGELCKDVKIMFAWAKNAAPTTLPKDVGFRTGGDSGVNYLLLQVHYAHSLTENDTSGILLHTTYEQQKYIAGIMLLLSRNARIPPQKDKVHADINCVYDSKVAIHPFAYRVHAHSLGTVIVGYKYNTEQGKWTLLGKGNPQWPQAFYPMDRVHSVNKTEVLAARCTFNSTGRDRWTYIGSTAADEMCNFYIMYYTDSMEGSAYKQCTDAEDAELVASLPKDSDVQLPRNPLLEEHAAHSSGMHHQHNDNNNGDDNLLGNTDSLQLNKKGNGHRVHPPVLDYYPEEYSYEDAASHEIGKTPIYGGREGETLQTSGRNHHKIPQVPEASGGYPHRGKVNHGNKNQDDSSLSTNGANPNAKGKGLLDVFLPLPTVPNLYTDAQGWPIPENQLGQVTAVSIDSKGNIVIFHRAKRVWNSSTFDKHNRYRASTQGSIQENTIVKFDAGMGSVIQEWGSNMFYLPHGLTIDKDDNVWVTDVALHQVMKFPPAGAYEPTIILGVKLEPGHDDIHYCKPTSVAVATDGTFFVADGYCNHRILKYSADGKLILQWGQPTTKFIGLKLITPPPYAMEIPHKLTLAEDKGLLCVADRENGRIQCFSMLNGTFHCQLHPAQFGDRLFAVAYSAAQGGVLFAVNGPSLYGISQNVQGFLLNITSGNLLGSISPTHGTQLLNPHDIAVSQDGSTVYVAEIGPNKIWKFNSVRHSSKKVLDPGQADETSKVFPGQSRLAESPDVTNASMELNGPKKVAVDVDPSNLGTSLIIMALLSIPILLMIVITIFVRLRKQGKLRNVNVGHVKGWMTGYKQPNADRFNLGNFLSRHKGFDPVNIDESDGEAEGSDSDVEEFSATVQKA